MTSTALSLVISAIIKSIQRSISLLDVIVVEYGHDDNRPPIALILTFQTTSPVLLLPILASAFGISEIISASESKHTLLKVHSSLLIVANWTRSVFTYSFAIYVWVTAPTSGSGPPRMQRGYQTHLLWRESACSRERPRAQPCRVGLVDAVVLV